MYTLLRNVHGMFEADGSFDAAQDAIAACQEVINGTHGGEAYPVRLSVALLIDGKPVDEAQFEYIDADGRARQFGADF